MRCAFQLLKRLAYLAAIFSMSSLWAAPYNVIDLGLFSPSAINAQGQIAGYTNGVPQLWAKGAIQNLAAVNGSAYGINNSRHVVGDVFEQGVGRLPALYAGGGVTPLGYLDVNHPTGVAWSISEQGVIVGSSGVDAFYWVNGTMYALPNPPGYPSFSAAYGVNNAGTIVGRVASFTADGSFYRAVVWKGGIVTELPGLLSDDENSTARMINNAGWISGQTGVQAVLWHDGSVFALDGLPNVGNSDAYAISDRGLVVGLSVLTDGSCVNPRCGRATLWHPRFGVFDLDRQVPADLIEAGWHLGSANGVNNHGEIIAFARQFFADGTASAYHGFLLVPTGEKLIPPAP